MIFLPQDLAQKKMAKSWVLECAQDLQLDILG
jgi:hypothetical protein